MSEKEEKLRKKLQAARYPNVDVSIGIGEWLFMSDLFDEAEVNVVFVDSKRLDEFKHTHITIALSNQAIDNPKFGLLEFIKKNLSETRTGDDRDYLNGKEDIHEKSITLQENVYKEYLKLLNNREDFEGVDCFDDEGRFLPKEQIHEKIWEMLVK